MGTLHFEDFKAGHVYDHEVSRSVTDFDNIWASCMTLNVQPLHISFDFAQKKTTHQRPIFNSMYTLGIVVGQASQELTRASFVEILLMTDINFPRPVFAGDTLYSRTTIRLLEETERRDSGIVEFFHEGLNQDREIVASVTRRVLVRKRQDGEVPAV